ncbi:MAG: hypothetical protein M1508_03735 [Nitrospirae bacterium]|nr:hypothetical protein [Nitrospirota bacterium]MCL5423122.1 hypothetical protein [Nitrospirota bacterium]
MPTKKIYGWTGKILKIDLTTGLTSIIPTMDYAERFVGGRGINAKLHFDEVPASVGAFDPENRLTVMTGPLTGTIAPTSGRVEVGGKSPQTYPNESYTVSSFGGWWGPELKYAGFDGLIIYGKAPKPVYLYIRDGKIQLRDAAHLWGKDIFTTQEMLWKELGDGRKPQVLAIGPAGENMIRFAIMMHGSSSASGQGGFGGVCGSKNLKAIVVRGTGYVEAAKPKELMDVSYAMNRWIYRADQRPEQWTNIASFHRIGWSFFQGQKVKGWKWLKNYTRKAEACHACPLGCRVFSNITDSQGRQGSAKCNQFWYEKYDVQRHKDITEVFYKAAKMADAMGVNGFELIGMIPWLQKCFEEKIFTREDTGIAIEDVGTLEFAEKLLKMITYKEGFGKILSEGSPRAADIIGRGSQKHLPHMNRGFAHHWDPQLWSPQALFWAMETRHPVSSIHAMYWVFRMYVQELWPAAGFASSADVVAWSRELFGTDKAIDYSDENFYDPVHATVAKWMREYDVARRSMIVCSYGPTPLFFSSYSSAPHYTIPLRSPDLESRLFSLVTGSDLVPDGAALIAAGQRIINVERVIAAREGRTREHDTLADYLFTKKKKGKVTGPGGKAIAVERAIDRTKFESLRNEYYRINGWDAAKGHPRRETLDALNLKDISVAV